MAGFTTCRPALLTAVKRLEASGIASAGLDASVLLAHVLGLSREQVMLNPGRILTDKEISSFQTLVARRAQHEPIAYITGQKEFWSLDFYVTRDTLIPRPDSETLILAALKRVRSDKTRGKAEAITLLDIGTGTGCLIVSLLKELPQAIGVGVDDSERALRVAEENARRHGVESRVRFIRSHWCNAIDGTFDLILSNPPYIALNDKATLMTDVLAFEPESALFAGADGLDAYRVLSPQVSAKLNPGGHVLFEVGQGQADAVEALLAAQGLKTETAERDLSGTARCVVARKEG